MIVSVKLNIFIAPKIKTIDVKNKVIASILHNFASSYCSFSFALNVLYPAIILLSFPIYNKIAKINENKAQINKVISIFHFS